MRKIKKSEKYLIIGLGISGCLLVNELRKRGLDFTVVSAENSSTTDAAGWLINPVTGLRFVKSWRIQEFLPFAKSYYKALEKQFGLQLWHPKQVMRLFRNKKEVERWRWRKQREDMSGFVIDQWDQSRFDKVKPSLGGILINQAAWVDIPLLMEHTRNMLRQSNKLISAHIKPEELEHTDTGVIYAGTCYNKAIFCTGYSREWPWFDWLPWKPAKGETLELLVNNWPDHLNHTVLYHGIFILPMITSNENQTTYIRIGATYEWQDLEVQPTEQEKSSLLKQLEELIDLDYEVIDHKAGIRPIIKDTHPVIGKHPAEKFCHYYLFNGMGSKGALWAPFFAKQLIDHIEDKNPLDPEVDLLRNL